MSEIYCGNFTDELAEPEEQRLPAPRMTAEDIAVESERNRRNAKDIVDAERAATVPVRTGRVKLKDLVAQAVVELEVRREHGLSGFKTGVESFDKLAAPMFQPGRVIGVPASTKTGKTTVLWQWAVQWAAAGLPGFIMSFEDEGTDSVYRALANVASGNVGDIRSGFVTDGVKQDIPEGFDTAAKYVSSLNIEVSNTPSTCTQIAFEVGDWVQSWESGTYSGFLVVDQLSHLVPDDPGAFKARFPGFKAPPRSDDTVKLLEWQVEMLQRIARKWNILVIVAMQRNEQDKDWEWPTIRSVRDSRGIAHKVDALVVPHRPGRLPNPNPGPGQPETVPNDEDRMWLCVPIARHIPGGFRVEVEWQGAHQRVAELGARMGDDWVAPEQVSEEQKSGMAAYAAVRDRWARHVDQVAAAANGRQEAPEAAPVTLKAIGTLGAKWALPTAPEKKLQEEAPGSFVPPAGGFGFGGGGARAVYADLL